MAALPGDQRKVFQVVGTLFDIHLREEHEALCEAGAHDVVEDQGLAKEIGEDGLSSGRVELAELLSLNLQGVLSGFLVLLFVLFSQGKHSVRELTLQVFFFSEGTGQPK